MSVKHIDFLKIKPSKLLVVEIRPVRCIIYTSSGSTRTAKWMNFYHWKELRSMINDIADEYEEQRNKLQVIQDIKCNKPLIKIGTTIKIGYMFTTFRKCSCHYLTPRENGTWTDDEDDDDSMELIDKGGRYDSFMPCGEMLVVSVTLLKPLVLNELVSQEDPIENVTQKQTNGEGSRQARSSMTSLRHDRQLLKALDSTLTFASTISDYFEPSQKLSGESSANQECLGNNEQKTLKKMASKSRSMNRKRKIKNQSTAKEINLENENPNKSQVMNSHVDTQPANNSLDVLQGNNSTLFKNIQHSLQNSLTCKPKTSWPVLASDSDEDSHIINHQTVVDGCQTHSDIQYEQSQLSDWGHLNNVNGISNKNNQIKNLDEDSNGGLPNINSTLYVRQQRNSKVKEKKLSNNQNDCYQRDDEQDFSNSDDITRSYNQPSNKLLTSSDKKKKIRDYKDKALYSKKENHRNTVKGEANINYAASRSPSPVLGISKGKLIKNLPSYAHSFCPQVTDQTEEMEKIKDTASEDSTQQELSSSNEEKVSNSMNLYKSQDLPDLTLSDPVVPMKVPLGHIQSTKRVSHHGKLQNSTEIIKPLTKSEMDGKVAKVKKNEKKKFCQLFNKISKTKKNTDMVLESQVETSSPSKSEIYSEAEYVPENTSNKDSQGSTDCPLPYVPTPKRKHKSNNEDDNDSVTYRRSQRIKENTNRSNDSVSLDLKHNAQPLKRRTVHKHKRKDLISGHKISSPNHKSKTGLLTEKTLKSLANLEKCRREIEMREKLCVDETILQKDISNFSQGTNSLNISHEPKSDNVVRKCKSKLKSCANPKNQLKLTGWITKEIRKENKFIKDATKKTLNKEHVINSKTKRCKKNNFKTKIRSDSFSKVSKLSKSEKNECILSCESEKINDSNVETGCSSNTNKYSELTSFETEAFYSSPVTGVFDKISSQEQCSTDSDRWYSSGCNFDKTQCSYILRGRNSRDIHSKVDTADIEQNMIALLSEENSSSEPQKKLCHQDDSIFVTHEEYKINASLQSMITSYNRLQQMTIEELEDRLEQAVPYLTRVTKGQELSERHEIFKRGGRELREMSDELIYGPYSEEQINYVINYLTEKFAYIRKVIGDEYRGRQYIWKVLAPTLLIKIVMENEDITQDNAEKLLIEFSLNRNITSCSSPPI
nr:uncharacterized protein LOC123760601 isoform X1 [Procambarus clarkii]